MSISIDEAVEIARKHGLSMSDARALSVSATDIEHAEQLAARFARNDEAADDGPDPLETALTNTLGPGRGGESLEQVLIGKVGRVQDASGSLPDGVTSLTGGL